MTLKKTIKKFKKKLRWIPWSRLGFAIGCALVIFLFMNAPYFWIQIRYFFSRTNQQAISQTREADLEKKTWSPNTLEIPDLSIQAPVIYVDKKTEAVFQEALKKGVVHYPGTAKPGEYGNVYIFGHSSDLIWSKGEYKTVFALLPKILVGQEIILTDEKGTPFVYKVTKSFIAEPDDLALLSQNGYLQKELTLQTSYPLGTALKRFIVIAQMMGEPRKMMGPSLPSF